jgi:hypothetical protein
MALDPLQSFQQADLAQAFKQMLPVLGPIVSEVRAEAMSGSIQLIQMK